MYIHDLAVLLLIWLAKQIRFNINLNIAYSYALMHSATLNNTIANSEAEIYIETYIQIYSETCLLDHLRKRDNLGIKDIYCSP